MVFAATYALTGFILWLVFNPTLYHYGVEQPKWVCLLVTMALWPYALLKGKP